MLGQSEAGFNLKYKGNVVLDGFLNPILIVSSGFLREVTERSIVRSRSEQTIA